MDAKDILISAVNILEHKIINLGNGIEGLREYAKPNIA
jgi:hypothetical protein